MKRILLLIVLGLPFCQCTPKTGGTTTAFRANPLPDSVRIYTLQPGEFMPDSSEFVRDIQMGASLFSSSCGYKNLMNYAVFTARQSGANLVQFTEIRRPTMGNGCYHVSAKLYKNNHAAQLAKIAGERQVANRSRLPKDADYAVVYFYRPKDYEGAAISYNIKMDNQETIGKASNGHQFEYKVTTFGKHRFVGKTRKADNVVLDIQKGQEYFVRCGVTKGTDIAVPDMYVIENYVGIREMAGMQ